ncbi:Arylsulfatase [Rubripirellula obstinata]|uniref:Arylsulfatase n=2 Tax=Rubripirellula obstinata TaxID=406547 RepID=A0A5B1CMU9_9BACT|nr:Arylsulfatase [Rubripirellula obstinata]
MLLAIIVIHFLFSSVALKTINASDPKRPNIVWIISEDNSKHYLNHFDSTGTPTPAIESLARAGVTFDHAFSCSPVCSVARTTLITGCYAPRIGTAYHRAFEPAMMPAGIKMFPVYLRDSGYYTTNNSKKDYNVRPGPKVWDESSRKANWKNRPSDETPFFHVQTIKTSHESSLHPEHPDADKPLVTDPASITLQPYFPDTPLMRKTVARYHDLITSVDQQVGDIIQDLKNAGELENTFVFYFGDHGGVLPRSKGYVFESGLHVPLVIRIPANFTDTVDRERGSRVDGFVEFVDFGPTTLNLAGIEIPERVDGKAFLGKQMVASEVDQRDEAFGHADRFDEKYDVVRSLRVGQWKYIRNFEPFYPNGMYSEYRYKMIAMQQWQSLHTQEKLTPIQDAFFQPKLPEALYDLDADPHETVNLANDPAHQQTLLRMRDRLNERLVGMPDLGFVPEAYLVEDAMTDPVTFGRRNQDQIKRFIETANLQLLDWEDAKPKVITAIYDQDPLVRLWGLVAATSFGVEAKEISKDVEKRLVDLEPLVVIRAVEYFASLRSKSETSLKDPLPFLYRSLQRSISEPEALRVLNTAVFVRDHCGTDGDDRLDIDPRQLQTLPEVGKSKWVKKRIAYLSRSR